MKLKFTIHATDQMIERGVTKREVVETINKGSKFKQNNKLVAKYRYITVVYERKRDYVKVITIMIGEK